MINATLFDFNGVLVDDEAVHLRAFREVLATRSISLTDAEYTDRYLGFDDFGAFAAILRDRGMPATDAIVRALIEEKVPVYMRAIATELRVFDGAAELVQRRAARGVVGIVSGALRHEIEHCLGVMKVRALVSFVVSAEDTRACKPDPEGYQLGIRKLGATACAIVVEDSVAGVVAAKAAGLRCIAITHSYPRAALLEAGADHVADTLADLTDEVMEGA